MTSNHCNNSHSVLIIRNFTIVKLFVRHWLRSPKSRMQSCNPPLCANQQKIQSANFCPPSKNKITHSQIFSRKLTGFALRIMQQVYMQPQNIHLHIRCRKKNTQDSNIKVGQVESIHYFDSTYCILLVFFSCTHANHQWFFFFLT